MFKQGLKSNALGLVLIMGCSTAFSASNTPISPFYAQVNTGVSFSMISNINVGSMPYSWDPCYEGYDASLGTAGTLGGGIGYNIAPWLSTMLSVDWRGTYEYSKYQTVLPGVTIDSPYESHGDKTRHFSLSNLNLLLNFIVNGSTIKQFKVDFKNGSYITPYVGVGFGVARNQVSSFYAKYTDPLFVEGNYSTTAPKTSYSFAAQGMLGGTWVINPAFNMDLGYKLYYGGQYKTNGDLTNTVTPTTYPGWKGKLVANEMMLSLRYNI